MTEEQIKAKELAELLIAFAEGKQLQFLDNHNRWCNYCCSIGDIAEEFLTIEDIQIRIEPETKRVPLTKDDLVDRIKEGKTMWLSTNELVLRFTDTHIYTSHGGATPYLFAFQHNYTFLDGTPCYKEVEL